MIRNFFFRHVILPKDLAKLIPKTHLMSESEWRSLGVQQSQGWVHYMIHEPGELIKFFLYFVYNSINMK